MNSSLGLASGLLFSAAALGAEVSWRTSTDIPVGCKQVLSIHGAWRCESKIGDLVLPVHDAVDFPGRYPGDVPVDDPAMVNNFSVDQKNERADTQSDQHNHLLVEIPKNFVKDQFGKDFPAHFLAQMNTDRVVIPEEFGDRFRSNRPALSVQKNKPRPVLVNHRTSLSVTTRESLVDSPLTSSAGIKYQVAQQAVKTGGLTGVRPRTVGDYDPFKVVVEWNWSGITVGEGVKRIASFVGYTVLIGDDHARGVYSMPLPASHKVVSGINTGTALELLGGPAFTVVVNHANRTLMHLSRPRVADSSGLPVCPDNLGFVAQSGKAWITESGDKCVIKQP